MKYFLTNINRKLQLQHDLLVDQISFLSLDRPSLEGSSGSNLGLVPNLSLDLDRTLTRDEDKFFESDEEEPSVKEKILIGDDQEKLENCSMISTPEKCDASCNTDDVSFAEPEEDEVQVDSVEQDMEFSNQHFDNEKETGPLTSTPLGKQVEQKSQEVQTPAFSMKTKRKKRSPLVNVKKTKKPIIILPGQRLVPVISEDLNGESFEVCIVCCKSFLLQRNSTTKDYLFKFLGIR